MLSHHNQIKHRSGSSRRPDLEEKRTLEDHQKELFQAQKKLDLYRQECDILAERIREYESSLNQHIEHYASWLAKRNLMVKALGRDASASKALIARAEAACLRLETLVEGLRTGSKEAQRRIFRILKSEINRAVKQAVKNSTKVIFAEYKKDLTAFQEAHSGVNPQGSGWHERVKTPAKDWIHAEQIIDKFNLNILQLERQVEFHRQSVMQAPLAILSPSQSNLSVSPTGSTAQANRSAAINGFSHYAWMPSFYRSGTHFQIIAGSGIEKSIFLNNFLGWVEYNIPRANICISELTNKPGAWHKRSVDYLGADGVMRHWNEFQDLLEARIRSQRDMDAASSSNPAVDAPMTDASMVALSNGISLGETGSSSSIREHYAVFDEYEASLPYAPNHAGSEFRSVLLAGDMPKMHLIFVSQSPQCGSVELTAKHCSRIARIIIGEALIGSLMEQQGHDLFGSQFKAIQQQFTLWHARAQHQSSETQVQRQHRSFGLIQLNRNWQFVMLPPPLYFVGKHKAVDNSTRIQGTGDTEILFTDTEA